MFTLRSWTIIGHVKILKPLVILLSNAFVVNLHIIFMYIYISSSFLSIVIVAEMKG